MEYTEQTLCARIERGYRVGASTATRVAVTGEPYVVIGHSDHEEGPPAIPGVVEEGDRGAAGFDAETAWYSALNAFELYAENRGGNLYWRVRPQLEWNDEHSRCRFYMRLLVSEKAA